MKALVGSIALAALAASASADLGIYTASLSGAEEVPPVATSAAGNAAFSFDDSTGALLGGMSASGFIYPIVGAHIHTAAPGVDGPIVVDLGLPTLVGSDYVWTINMTLSDGIGPDSLTKAQFKSAMDTGGAYINIHTSVYPAGEIRGQIAPVPEPATIAALGLGAFAVLRRKKR